MASTALLRTSTLIVAGLVAGLTAAETDRPDPATAILAELRTANQARADLAREEAAWTSERQRLEALLAATRAETARLERDATAATARRDASRERIAALSDGSDLDRLRGRLAQAGARLGADLARLAQTLPPGILPPTTTTAETDERAFDSALHALEAAERAAGTVAVTVVSGVRDGRPEAVRVLRVAGAAAWWAALDHTAAGTLRYQDETMQLTATADPALRATILAALAQAEGHGPASVLLLPAEAP